AAAAGCHDPRAAGGGHRPLRALTQPGAAMDRLREEAQVSGGADASPSVVVLDHGSGNVRSVVRALEAAGARVELTADRERALAADGLVVPGVGAFAATIGQVREVGGDRIIERRLAGGRPVLGICVGLQILFDEGHEHAEHSRGLGQWPGQVTRLEAEVLPHMGWNLLEVAAGSKLLRGLEDQRFYFVHSYAARSWRMAPIG